MNLVLKHYTKLKPLICTVVSGDIDKLVTVRCNDIEHKDVHFRKGDPVILGTLGNNDELQLYGGRILATTPLDDNFLICTKKVKAESEEELRRRGFYRYPTSLLADVKVVGANNWEDACIIDISYSGMRIYSGGNFDIGSNIELNIYLNDNILKFDAIIVRKTKTFKRNEYGIQILNQLNHNVYAEQKKIYQIIKNQIDLLYRYSQDYNLNIHI